MNHPHTAFSGARARGFTLFELMIVLSIAAIMAAMAVPGMRSFLQTQQQISAVSNLITNLNYARSEAIKGGRARHRSQLHRHRRMRLCVRQRHHLRSGGQLEQWLDRLHLCHGDGAGNHRPAAVRVDPEREGPAAAAVTFLPNGMTNTGALTEFVLCDSRGASYAREVEVDVTGRIQASSTPGFDVTGTTALVCP